MITRLDSCSLLASVAMLALVSTGCPNTENPVDPTFGSTGSGGTGMDDNNSITFLPSEGSEDSGVASGGSGDSGVADSGSSDGSDGGDPVCGNGVIEGDETCDDRGESASCDADCTAAECGDGTVNPTAGENCDDGGKSPMCNANCTAVTCGDGVLNEAAGEECDDGGFSAGCDDDCTLAMCGDGVTNPNAAETCDDMGESATCDADCTPADCGDGVINMAAGEDCDDTMQTELCEVNCTAPSCGDGIINMLAGEECDGMGESVTCDADCTAAECGDGVLNVTAGEICDDGGVTMTCDIDCTDPMCGDGVLNVAAGEDCDDGNMIDDDGCTNCMFDIGTACLPPAVTVSTAPSGNMVLCDDPANALCEEDFETVCPPGWGLCTRLQHINRNDGWDVPLMVGGTIGMGEVHCRMSGGAGNYTLGAYDGVTNMMDDPPLNCGYGGSRSACPTGYGCNNLTTSPICCLPTPTCGNGVVDHVEEECDDGNLDETDDCLNSCSWTTPAAMGVPGVGC